MNQILIRADGAKNLGMGHLNRCYLLAHYLQNKYSLIDDLHYLSLLIDELLGVKKHNLAKVNA